MIGPSTVGASLWQLVPALVSDFIEDGRVAVPAERRFDGAFLTADIVGFTSLAEKLATQGARGAERVAEVVNPYFELLVSAITRQGGHVHRFAGDAVMAVFPVRDGTLEGATRRAVRAGLDMAATTLFVEDADRHLEMRVGIASGALWAGTVGGQAQAEVLLGGDPIVESARAAGSAKARQLVAAVQALEGFGDVTVEAMEASLVRVTALGSVPPPPGFTLNEGAVDNFVPAGVLGSDVSLVGSGAASWNAELRRAHVLFVNVPAIDFSGPGVLSRVQAITLVLFGVLQRLEGRVIQYLADDAGLTLVAAWGLQGSTFEDGAARALRAGVELREALVRSGEVVRIGAATGTTLVGLRGSTTRFEPGIFGRTVNLAARLMQSNGVDSGVRADLATTQGTPGFELDAESAIKVKGFAEPVPVYRVRARQAGVARSDQRAHVPAVGRDRERALLIAALDRAASELVLVFIEGEAGAGKTLSLDELESEAQARGLRVQIGRGEPTEKDTPYFAWRAVFGGLFEGLEGDALEQALLERLPGEYARRRLPLLAPVLAIASTDNETTQHIQGQARADATRRLLKELLESGGEPRLLLIDDAQWLDSASLGLAQHLVRELKSGCVVLASRPGLAESPEVRAMCAKEGAVTVSLGPLGKDDTLSVAARTVGATGLQQKLAEFIFSRSHGNPFFASQLSKGLLESGKVTVQAGRAVLDDTNFDTAALSSIQSVLVSRIDRVAPSLQRLLKAAAVVGQTFDEETLSQAWPDRADLSALDALLETELVSRRGEHVFAFTQPLMKDAAYGLLTFAQRRELHGRLAGYLVGVRGTDDRQAALISHHYLEAEAPKDAIPFLERAGAHAMRAFASEEAITFYERVKVAADKAGVDAEPVRRARWERAIGEARLKLLDYEASEKHLAQALRLLGVSAPRTNGQKAVALMRELATQTWHRYFPRRAPVANASIALEAADITELEDEIHWYRNDALGLTLGAFKQLNLAENAHEASPQLVQAYASASVPTALVGMHGLAKTYIRSSEAGIEQVASLPRRAYAFLTQAVYHQGYGNFADVERCITRARDLFAELGDRHRHQQTLALETVLHMHRGTFDRARIVGNQLEASVGPDDPAQFLSWAIPARVQAAMVDGSLAAQDLADLEALSKRKLEGGELMLVLGVHAQALGYAEQHDAALEACKRALAHANSLMPSTYFGLRGYAGLYDAWVRQLARATRERRADLRTVVASTKKSEKHFAGFARAFRVGAPALAVGRARHALAKGKKVAAELRAASKAAREANLPWEALLAAGTAGALDGDLRREAETLQATLGASPRFVAWCALRIG